MGFDDEPHSTYFTPALSTVWQPVYSMGMLSARILLHDIRRTENDNLKLRYEVFKTELIIRGTSKSI
jgi:LacI family transcriptional regulator